MIARESHYNLIDPSRLLCIAPQPMLSTSDTDVITSDYCPANEVVIILFWICLHKARQSLKNKADEIEAVETIDT